MSARFIINKMLIHTYIIERALYLLPLFYLFVFYSFERSDVDEYMGINTSEKFLSLKNIQHFSHLEKSSPLWPKWQKKNNIYISQSLAFV